MTVSAHSPAPLQPVQFSGRWFGRDRKRREETIARVLFTPKSRLQEGGDEFFAREYLKQQRSQRRSSRLQSAAILFLLLVIGGDMSGLGSKLYDALMPHVPPQVLPGEPPKDDSWQTVSMGYESDSMDTTRLAQRDTLAQAIKQQMAGHVGAVFNHTEQLAAYVRPAVVKVANSSGFGSGYFYEDTGLIVTNQHVVDDDKEVTITLLNGKNAKGQVLGTNLDHDLALIKVDPKDFGLTEFPTLSLAAHGVRPEGQWVMAVGHPSGVTWTATIGIISSNDRTSENGAKVVQTDAAINKGNSGGPLVNMSGEVVALNSATATDREGIAYSVSADDIRAFVTQTLATKTP